MKLNLAKFKAAFFINLKISLILSLLFSISFSSKAITDSVAIQGYWLNESEEFIVEVYIVDEELKGRIVWIKDSLNLRGEPRRDIMNKNPKLRSRLLMGIDVFYGFKQKKDTWKNGKVYSFSNGHQYNAKLKINEEGKLQWTGYYGILVFLSRTKSWVRVTDKQKYGLK